MRRATAGAAMSMAVLLAGCGSSTAADQQPLPPAYPAVSARTTATTATATDAQAQAPEDTSSAPATTGTPATPAPRPVASKDILSAADRSSFAALQRSLGSPIGLAVSGLGLDRKIQVVGGLRDVVAWSTSKVPVAMAVVAAGNADSQEANLRAAITASDNAAAERLWASLGGGDAAAQAADAQLRAAGDVRTAIESRTLRSGFTPFGQTNWRLSDQVRFTAGMACTDAGLQVLDLMGQTIPAQRWGLGAVGLEAQLKGGWGPGTRPGAGSGYLDRQMGIVVLKGKPMAVTIAVLPADGQHGTGTAQLTRIARWLVAHADVKWLPKRARCG